jgi:hypothetical protein
MVVLTACSTAEPEPAQDAASVAQALTASVVDTGGVIARMAAVLEAALRERDGDDAAMRTRVRTAVAALVQSAQCMSLDWSLRSVTVHFDECTIPSTDERLDGSLTVRIRLADPSVIVTMNELTLGDDVFDGSVTAAPRGLDGALQLGVDAELTAVGPATTLVGRDLGLVLDVQGVTLSGEGEVISASLDGSATMTAVHWDLFDCLPSSGSVTFVDGDVSGVMTFLASTPETGEVELGLDRLPATTIALFPSCP